MAQGLEALREVWAFTLRNAVPLRGLERRVVRCDLHVGSITLCLDYRPCVCVWQGVCASVGSWEDTADSPGES